MKYRLIIFDFDGTLCDTRQNIIIAFRATMERLGLELRSEAACGATIGLTLRDGFRELYPAFDDAEIGHCVDTYRAIFAERRRELMPNLSPGVSRVLEELRTRGYILSIASSRLTDSLRLFMDAHDISRHFDFVVGSDSVERHKPDPEPVLMTLKELGYRPSEAFVVGDMPVDIAMAHGAGVSACGVTYGNATRDELLAAGAEYLIDDIEELLGVLP